MTYTPSLQRFSNGYFLFGDARVIEYEEDYPVLANDTYEHLADRVARPLFKIGGSYYWPKGEAAVPPDVVAVPEGTLNRDEADEVLVARRETAYDLTEKGVVAPPRRV
jgi:hypothetical protein